MIQQKFKYLLRSALNVNQEKKCPNCQGRDIQCVDQKYIVTKLYRCNTCRINFRFPVDSEKFQNQFYQQEYKANYDEVTEDITSLPSDDELNAMMDTNFANKRDYAPFIRSLLKASNGRVLDYGASWGYSVYQLKQAGFDAEGFEISRPRADFARKMNVTVHSSQEEVRNEHDVIMSSHAIEHIPVVSDFIAFSKSKLKPDGLFMAFCPNGSNEFRKRDPHGFHVNWGLLHPNFLDLEFVAKSFENNPFIALTSDWSFDLGILDSWDGKSQIVGQQRDGYELLMIAKPNVNIF